MLDCVGFCVTVPVTVLGHGLLGELESVIG